MTISQQPSPSHRRRKAARPAEIIAAGTAEFASKGFAGTKLDDVARRAGISKGTIYNYFGDKDALFRAAFRTHLIDTLDQLGPPPVSFDGPVAPLLQTLLIEAGKGLFRSQGLGLIRVLVAEADRFPELVRFCRDELAAQVNGTLRALIDVGIARDEFAPGDYRDDPLLLFAPALILALAQDPDAPVDEREAHRYEAFLELVMRGMLAHP